MPPLSRGTDHPKVIELNEEDIICGLRGALGVVAAITDRLEDA